MVIQQNDDGAQVEGVHGCLLPSYGFSNNKHSIHNRNLTTCFCEAQTLVFVCSWFNMKVNEYA